MAIDETEFRPGDSDNNLLRKILMTLLAGGTAGGGVASSVSVTGGTLTSAGNVVVTSGSLTSAGAVTIADGADVAEGARADAAETNPANAASVVSLLKGILTGVNTTPTSAGQQRGALTNASGSIAVGATSQAVAAALATRKYFFFQNVSTETMWINFGVAAVADQPSLEILSHASFVMEGFFVSTEAINVISATAGSKYVAKQA